MADVTIVMACRNEELLRPTLGFILNTAGSLSPKIILVDDTTTDGSLDNIETDYPVKLYHHHVQSPAMAKAFGISQVQTEYVILADAHMQYHPGWLEKFLYAIQSEPHAIYCATSAIWIPDFPTVMEPQNSCSTDKRMYGCKWIIDEKHKFPSPSWNLKIPDAIIAEIPALMGACYGFTKTTWDYLPGLPARHGFGYLETHLSLGANLLGVPLYLLTDVVARHFYRKSHPHPTNIAHMHEIRKWISQIFFDDMREEIQQAGWGEVFTDDILNTEAKRQKRIVQERRVMTDAQWFEKYNLKLDSGQKCDTQYVLHTTN